MRVFVLGKVGGITHWTEDSVAGLRAAGHEVRLGVTRDPRLHPLIERTLDARWAGAPRPVRLERSIRAFRPDLILAITALAIPQAILRRVAAMPSRPPFIGWVGDMMHATDRATAGLFDLVAYTDSGLLNRHHDLGFRSRAAWLPHAARPGDGGAATVSRQNRMVFVANPTPRRQALVARVREPLRLYGPGWAQEPLQQHDVVDRRVAREELDVIYRSHIAALNIRHEGNVLAGLNQRHFDPPVAGTLVVSDDQPDLQRCFEPGREVIVYRDPEELNEAYGRLLREPGYATALGIAAQRRVMSDHTYGRRLETLAALV